jgi:hypothetical protein
MQLEVRPPGSAGEAVSKLRIASNQAWPAPEARKTIARGEHSEPLVMKANGRSPGRGERY